MSAENFPGSGFPPSFEGLTADTSKSTNKEKKKEKKVERADEPAAKEIVKQPERSAEVAEVFAKQPNLWEKLLGNAEDKTPTKAEKPHKAEEAEQAEPGRKSEATAEKATDQTTASEASAQPEEQAAESSTETDPDTEAEAATIAELDVEEQSELVEKLVEARRTEWATAKTENQQDQDPAEEAAVDAYYDRVQEHAAEMDPEQAIEMAANEVVGENDAHKQEAEPAAEHSVETPAPEHAVAQTSEKTSGQPAEDQAEDAYAAPYYGGGGAGHWNMPPAGGSQGYDAQPGYGRNPNIISIKESHEREAEAASKGFIIGAVISGAIFYLWGRRNGRIKAQRLFEPVKKELEKKVEGVYQLLVVNEERVRKHARENAALERKVHTLSAAEVVVPVAAAAKLAAERPHEQARPTSTETTSASHHDKQEQTQEVPRKPEAAHYGPVSVEQMSEQEVLEIGKAISVGNLTVTEAYHDKHLITDEGLRRVVAEHLRGGDVRKVYKQEVMLKRVAVEIRHELDPSLHGRPLTVDDSWRGVQPQTANDQQLAAHDPATQAAHAANEPAKLTPLVQPKSRDDVPASLIVANIAALAILAILLVVFLIVWLTR